MMKHLPTNKSIYDEIKAAKNRKRQGAPQIEEEKKPQIKQAKLSDFKPMALSILLSLKRRVAATCRFVAVAQT